MTGRYAMIGGTLTTQRQRRAMNTSSDDAGVLDAPTPRLQLRVQFRPAGSTDSQRPLVVDPSVGVIPGAFKTPAGAIRNATTRPLTPNRNPGSATTVRRPFNFCINGIVPEHGSPGDEVARRRRSAPAGSPLTAWSLKSRQQTVDQTESADQLKTELCGELENQRFGKTSRDAIMRDN